MVNEFKLNVHMSEPVDLINHMYSHISLDDCANNLYEPNYIGIINNEKAKLGIEVSLEEEIGEEAKQNDKKIQSLRDYALEDQKFNQITFMGPYFNNVQDLFIELGKIAGDIPETEFGKAFCTRFKNDEKVNQKFYVSKFSNLAQKEYYTFYKKYRESKFPYLAEKADEFNDFIRSKELSQINDIFESNGLTGCDLFLSHNIFRNGKVNGRGDVIVKLPENETEKLKSYVQYVHEKTHKITNPLVTPFLKKKFGHEDKDFRTTDPNKPGYLYHLLTEFAVMYANYKMLKNINNYDLYNAHKKQVAGNRGMQKFLTDYFKYVVYTSKDKGFNLADVADAFERTKEIVDTKVITKQDSRRVKTNYLDRVR